MFKTQIYLRRPETIQEETSINMGNNVGDLSMARSAVEDNANRLEVAGGEIADVRVPARQKQRPPRRPYIFDAVTTIPTSEMDRRIRRIRINDADVYDPQHDERVELLKRSKYEHLNVDLMRFPSCKLAKRTNHVYSERELNSFVFTRMVKFHGCMTSTKQPDSIGSFLVRNEVLE